MIERLPSKLEVLSSNPSTAKGRKKIKKGNLGFRCPAAFISLIREVSVPGSRYLGKGGSFNGRGLAECWWLTPVFLATQQAEIRGGHSLKPT
jgi:hypothetical protein